MQTKCVHKVAKRLCDTIHSPAHKWQELGLTTICNDGRSSWMLTSGAKCIHFTFLCLQTFQNFKLFLLCCSNLKYLSCAKLFDYLKKIATKIAALSLSGRGHQSPFVNTCTMFIKYYKNCFSSFLYTNNEICRLSMSIEIDFWKKIYGRCILCSSREQMEAMVRQYCVCFPASCSTIYINKGLPTHQYSFLLLHYES